MTDLRARTSTDEQQRQTSHLSAADGWVIGASTLVVLALAGFRLGAPSLWFDETVSAIIADGDLLFLWRTSAESEASGALYYLLLSSWQGFGTSEWVLRSLSVLIAVVTIPVFHMLAREMVAPTAARISTVLLAVNAFFVTYARELRGYGLALFLVTVATLALLRALRGDRASTIWWALWALAGGLSAYAHLFGALVVASQVLLFPLLLRDRDLWRPALTATAGAGVLVVPMGLFLVTNTGGQLDWVPPLAPGSFLWLARQFSGAPLDGPASLVLLVPAVAFGAMGAFNVLGRTRTSWRSEAGDRGLLLLSWVLVPIVVAATASVLIRPVFVPRYFLVVLPAVVLLIAVGIAKLGGRPALMVAAVIAVAASGVVTITTLYDEAGRQDWRQALSIVSEEWTQGDAIALAPNYFLPAVDYYTARTTLSSKGAVPVYVDRELGVYRGRGDVIDLRAADLETIEASRVWYLSVGANLEEATERSSDGAVADSPSHEWELVDSRTTKGIDVRLLAPVDPSAADPEASS